MKKISYNQKIALVAIKRQTTDYYNNGIWFLFTHSSWNWNDKFYIITKIQNIQLPEGLSFDFL